MYKNLVTIFFSIYDYIDILLNSSFEHLIRFCS